MRLDYVLIYPGALVAIASVVALMVRRGLPDQWSWSVAGLGVVRVAARLVASCLLPLIDAHDIGIFWETG